MRPESFADSGAVLSVAYFLLTYFLFTVKSDAYGNC